MTKDVMIRIKGLQYAEGQESDTTELMLPGPAKASLAQAQAQLTSATQNLDFCTVTSPSNGVVGTFPYRVGSLVSPSVAQPLTTVSEIGDMYVYFSMTEKQLLAMTKAGGTLKDQKEKMPAVKLELADGTVYAEEGRIDAVSGVIDQSTGSVSMRAIFPNKQSVLRSGGMANVIFPYTMEDIILIPQSATQEIQDKKFVYVLQSDNTLKHTEIQVSNLNDDRRRTRAGTGRSGPPGRRCRHPAGIPASSLWRPCRAGPDAAPRLP